MLILFLGFESALCGASYYVSPGGSDANSGNVVAPFKTLAKAAGTAMGGDTVYLRQGVYRETLNTVRSGASGSPIVFSGYAGEDAVLAGSNLVTGTWSVYSGKIWQIDGLPSTVDIFVDGVEMQGARWPNAAVGAPMDSGWAAASAGSATSISDASLPPLGLNGAHVQVIPGSAWVSNTRVISSYGGGSFSFPSVGSSASYWPKAGNLYKLYGHLALLDSPGEWFQDPGTNRLYLWLPDGLAPSTHTIEYSARKAVVSSSSYSNLEFKNFYTFCGGIDINGCTGCKVTAVHQKYIQHQSEVDGYSFELTLNQFNGGSGCTWSDGSIEGSSGDGIFLAGAGHTVRNMLIHDVCQIATYRSAVRMSGSNHIIENNTFYDSGRFLIFHGGVKGGALRYNHLYNAGLLTMDMGATYCYRTDGGGMVISYNHVHDVNNSVGAGIYLDNGSSNFFIHHNVVHNCSYFALKLNLPSYNNIVVNNTLWGGKYWVNAAYNSGNPQQEMTGTALVNNLYFGAAKLVTGSLGPALIANNATYTAPPAIFASGTWQLAAGSPAIDQGRLYAPYTNGYCGVAPDQGAYEYACGMPWVPGCSVTPGTFPYPQDPGSPSATPSCTRTPTPSITTPTYSRTPSPSVSPTGTLTSSVTATATPARTPTSSVTATATLSRTPTPSVTFTSTFSSTPTSSVSSTPSFSRTATPSASPAWTVTFTSSLSPSRTSTPSRTVTVSCSPTQSATATLSFSTTPTLFASAQPSVTFTPSATSTTIPAPAQPGLPDEDAKLIEGWCVPNPNPTGIYLSLKGRPEKLRLELYTRAMRKIDDQELNVSAASGRCMLAMPAAWNGIASGTYFVRVSLPGTKNGVLILKMGNYR